MNHLVRAATLLVAMAVPAVHAQQQKGPLESTLEQHRVMRAADGAESLASAGSVKPGDVIEYIATYRNTGRAPITGVEATMPIPPNTEFVAGSARPASAKASVDGVSYAPLPLVRKVVRDGKTVEEPIPTREYRYLRWSAPELRGEQSVRFTARVKVLEDTSPQAAGKGGGR
jgi:uncharacterized repeat protein (TIGR01451 family)